MAPNKRLMKERGQLPEKAKTHPGGMFAGLRGVRPGKHRMALFAFAYSKKK